MTMRCFCLVLLVAFLVSTGTSGAVVPETVKLKVVSTPGDAQGKGTKSVKAEALVAQINTSEQLKVIALDLLEHLKNAYPNCPSYSLVISDDAKMMKIGNYLAVATFREGKTAVTGGIPTNMDIRVMKASHVEVRRPDPLGIDVTYDVARLRTGAIKQGKPLSDTMVYARIAEKYKMKAEQVKQVSRGITQYYKAFDGKPM